MDGTRVCGMGPGAKRGRRIASLAGGIALVLASVALAGTAGTLDATFDGDGVARLPLGDRSWGTDVVVQPDAKILVAGSHYPASGGLSAIVARYLPSGALDAGFGSAGVAHVAGTTTGAHEIALLADGRILVAARAAVTITSTSGSGKKQTTTTTTLGAAVVARLNANGSLDTSFGDGGLATVVPPKSADGSFHALALRPDGRILAGGYADQPGARRTDVRHRAVLLAQFTASGALDASFGVGGFRMDDLTTSDDQIRQQSLVLQADGGVVAACGIGFTSQTAMRRYTASGAFDTAFGTKTVPGMTYLVGLAGDALGRLVATGRGPNGGTTDQAAVARFLPDGTLDGSFGVGGIRFVLPTGASRSQAYHPAFAADGTILVPADRDPVSGSREACAFRLTASGALDATFGTGGFSPSLGLAAGPTQGTACAVATDGGVLLAGTATASNSLSDGFVARFLGN